MNLKYRKVLILKPGEEVILDNIATTFEKFELLTAAQIRLFVNFTYIGCEVHDAEVTYEMEKKET